MVVLGVNHPKEAAAERVKEEGRYFLMYEIQEVGMILIDSTQTTQPVIPLNSHPSIFPCFF
jgi:hypothetical protein